MDRLVGFLLHIPLSEIGKKIGKMLKYTPTFKGLSAPLISKHVYYKNCYYFMIPSRAKGKLYIIL